MKKNLLFGLIMTAFCFAASAQDNDHNHRNETTVYRHQEHPDRNAVVHQRTVTRTETQHNVPNRNYNHGQQVRNVAHNAPRGRYHGEEVRNVARTNTYSSTSSHAAKYRYNTRYRRHNPDAHVVRHTTSTTVRQSY